MGCVVTEHRDSGILPHASRQTAGQTATHICMPRCCEVHTSIEALPVEACPLTGHLLLVLLLVAPMPASDQDGRHNITACTYIQTYTHAASGRFSRPAYGVHARAYIPRRLILSPAAAATGAVRLASVSAVLVLHPGIGQLLFLNLFRFRLLLRRSPLLVRFVLNPFVSLSVPAGGPLLVAFPPTWIPPSVTPRLVSNL
ncbi:hypothetical protein V8C26DRAFT_68417 [Trichoderma gracile]